MILQSSFQGNKARFLTQFPKINFFKNLIKYRIIRCIQISSLLMGYSLHET